MAKAKPKKEEEVEAKQDEPKEFVGPPLIPGRPAFWRWFGYFDVGPGDTVKDIKEFRKRTGRA
jgi:hypothetical protein